MSEVEQDTKFVLRADLRDHLDQVRSIAPYPLVEGAVITCSLDRTVKLWMYKDGNNQDGMDTTVEEGVDKKELLKKKGEYEVSLTFIGHENTVLDVTYWPPNEQNNNIGNIVSASNDKSIIIWKLNGEMQDRYINAHTGPVSALTIDQTTHNIISGSWDKLAKVWSTGQCIHELKGHEGNILCVIAASNGDIITGSGDGSIRIWRDGKEFKAIKSAHSAPVRSLVEKPGMGFISTSNDCMVKIWTLTGDPIHQFQAHDNLVYSCAVLSPSELATASEDKTVKIWKDFQLVQTIEHPGCVWKVIGLSNGDIATACADGAARIFTRNHAKIADPEIVKDLDDLILAGKKKVSGVDPSSLPQAGILAQTKGKEDGEVKLVSSNGIPEAYSWSAAKGTWEKMGEVVDGPSMGSGFAGKTYYNGKMYDYVFDIELDTGMGMAKYKLPYNRGENPYEAAQNFIWKHNLSQFHLDQIAKFVINNSDYQGSMVTPQSMRGDPFTGHQREMGSSAPSQPKPTGNVELSGYAREQIAYQKELEERERQKKIQHIPSSYSPFDTANYPGISKKLSEFQTSVNMDSTSWKDLNQLIELLKVADLQKVEAKHIAALDAALKWPADKVFPVVDLARLVILTDAGANYFFQQYQTSKRNILTELLAVAFGESKNEALQMLTLRFLANMFQQAKLRFLAVSDSAEVLRKLSGACAGSTNANLKLAYATAVHNYAVYYTTYTQPNEAKEVILNIAKQGIPDESNQDIVYRFICGAGTLVNQGGDVVEQAKKTGLKEVFGQKISSPNAKVAAAAFQAFQLVRD